MWFSAAKSGECFQRTCLSQTLHRIIKFLSQFLDILITVKRPISLLNKTFFHTAGRIPHLAGSSHFMAYFIEKHILTSALQGILFFVNFVVLYSFYENGGPGIPDARLYHLTWFIYNNSPSLLNTVHLLYFHGTCRTDSIQ